MAQDMARPDKTRQARTNRTGRGMTMMTRSKKQSKERLFAEQTKCTKLPLCSRSGISPVRLFKDFFESLKFTKKESNKKKKRQIE
jgi:hypothetical protein